MGFQALHRPPAEPGATKPPPLPPSAFPLLLNSPWTASPDNWYILTSLTESLYLGRFTANGPKLPPERLPWPFRPLWVRFRQTLLSACTIQRINETLLVCRRTDKVAASVMERVKDIVADNL